MFAQDSARSYRSPTLHPRATVACILFLSGGASAVPHAKYSPGHNLSCVHPSIHPSWGRGSGGMFDACLDLTMPTSSCLSKH